MDPIAIFLASLVSANYMMNFEPANFRSYPQSAHFKEHGDDRVMTPEPCNYSLDSWFPPCQPYRQRGSRAGVRKQRSIPIVKPRRPTNRSAPVRQSNPNNLIHIIEPPSKNLPSIIMGNARSLNNKLDELAALCKYTPTFTNASLLCFSETWFKEAMTREITNIDGFSVHRGDRDLAAVNKDDGGGVCVYVNEKWCHMNNVHKKLDACTPDLEILALSLRPHYIPREFSHTIVMCVYIPCRANTTNALNTLASHVHDLESKFPDAFFIITGDFNNRTLSKVLPSYKQHVKCNTRNDKTIDLCYTNVKDAYTATTIAPLGRSDHNMIQLTPKYVPKVKREPPKTMKVKQWTAHAIDTLNSCLETTQWSTFIDSSSCLNELTVTVCDYINFCVDSCIPEKTITVYQNNKPWLTKTIKTFIKEKNVAFRSGDRDKLKVAEKNLRKEIRRAKRDFKNKLEDQFSHGGVKLMWNGLSAMTGYLNKKKNNKQSESNVQNPENYVNELNEFYARFDNLDFSSELSSVRNECEDGNVSSPIVLEEHEVRNAFKIIDPSKGPGPDRVHPKVIKNCFEAVCPVFTYIFNLSLKTCTVPEIWKTSCIIPVPKKSPCQVMNDLRPVAMTSVVMKTFERLLLTKLQPAVSEFIDPLQFAYCKKRGVEDAILYVINEIYSQLDCQGTYARLLFFDFSSAFNTIQPHLMGKKLKNMNFNEKTIMWILDYLTNRPQFVKFLGHESNVIKTQTGAPQGTVLSPFLFTLYTSDCRLLKNNPDTLCTMVKYADDTSLCGFIRNGDETGYRDAVHAFVQWCESNYLLLNVSKTKEMIIDFRRNKNPEDQNSVVINGEIVERVSTYKYLGVTFDERLTWTDNTTAILKKCHSRLFFLRKLNSFHASTSILIMFYKAIILSIVNFCAICWGGNVSQADRDRLDRVIRKASNVIGVRQSDFATILTEKDSLKMANILLDTTNPLHNEFGSRRLKSGRFRVPKLNTERYRSTFVPRAINQHNKQVKR